MATNFPTSLDTLTNPTSSDSLASPSHASQHANVNDAVEALQAKVGVDGSAVTSSLDYKLANLGTWTTYTPSWTGTGGTPTIGNGTLTGKYLRINNVVMGSVIMTLGSTSTIAGISEWRWSYPSGLSPANTVSYQALGSGLTIDAGTAGYRSMVFHLSGVMAVYASDEASTVGAAYPFTWTPANGDLVSFSFAYEVA